MNKKFIFALTFLASILFSDLAVAQKYWVKFKNKNGTPYTTSNPSAFLSAKAITRRVNMGIAIDQTDLPVTPSYVTQVDGVSGVTVLFRSKWLNGIVISVTNTVALTTINSFTFVQSSAPVNRYKIVMPAIDRTTINPHSENNKIQSPSAFNYGQSAGQASMIGADCMHNYGWRGQGVTIAVLDAGFKDVHIDNVFDSLRLQGRLKGTRDFVTGDTMVFEDHTHGSMVLSCMAAIDPGNIIGTAPKANYWLLRTEDVGSETLSEEYNWIRGAEFADSLGADMCTTSLGYTTFDGGLNNHTYAQLDGKTAPMSIASTMATRKGMLVLNAAGNEGGSAWNFISVPADADSIITVGAVDPTGVKAGFSSFGPTSDGRIKPDLCAQGGPAFVCNTGCFFGNGTSFATPVLAGAVACLLQYKPYAKPMQILGALKASANNSISPNNNVGWGIPNMCTASSNTLLSVSSNEMNDLNNSINIYPNPVSDKLNIEFANKIESNITIIINNVLGQVVDTRTLKSANELIEFNDFSSLKPGVYFLNIQVGNSTIVKKIVKQ
ncbi:MAG: S8 family peptidase [Bacteroidetes bacterium]|nr:S8 family peptidase [Bacteroidota bacterium]